MSSLCFDNFLYYPTQNIITPKIFAFSGSGYAGIGVFIKDNGFQDKREYIQVKLFDSLNYNKKYSVHFYANLSDSSAYAIDLLGIYFSNSAITKSIYDASPFYFIPQIESSQGNIISDKNGWTLISGIYVAHGGEQFITIGNFHNDANIDTLFVGGAINQGKYSYYYIDDVSVTEYKPDTTKPEQTFTVLPTLATDNIYLNYSNLTINNTHFLLYDVCGRKVKDVEITQPTAQQSIDITRYSAGMYFYRLVINGEEEYRGKIVVRK